MIGKSASLACAALLALGGCTQALDGAQTAAVAQAASPQTAMVASADGTRIAATCYNCDAERTLLLIHGWSQSQVVWRDQLPDLARNFRVVTYDLRGHGASQSRDSAAGYDGRWTMAEDAGAVLDHFGVRDCAIAVGWSFGAIAAADTAVRLGPDRICGAVFASGPPSPGASRDYFGPLMGQIGAMRTGPRGAEEEAAVTRFLRESYVAGSWDEALYDRIYADNMKLSPEQRVLVASRPIYDNMPPLRASNIPVLFIHGEEDPAYSVIASREFAAQLPGAQLRAYPGVGHWPFIEDSARFNRDLRSFARQVFADTGQSR